MVSLRVNFLTTKLILGLKKNSPKDMMRANSIDRVSCSVRFLLRSAADLQSNLLPGQEFEICAGGVRKSVSKK